MDIIQKLINVNLYQQKCLIMKSCNKLYRQIEKRRLDSFTKMIKYHLKTK